MTQRTIEPYRDEKLPERFLRWIETIRARFKTIPNYTESTGSPEGVIFGAKADRYYDLTADEVYIKTTQGGNTGWVLITTGGQDATFQGFGQWRYRTTTTGTPAAGRLEFDNIVIGLATEMFLNVTNDNGVDMSNFLALIQANDLVYVQISNDSTQYVVIQTDLPTLAAGVYTFPILLIEGVGSPPANNTPVSVVVASTSSGGGGNVVDGTVENQVVRWDVANNQYEPTSTVLINPFSPPINGRIQVQGSSSSDVTRAMLNVDIGNSVSAIWVSDRGGDGFYSKSDFPGTEEHVWGRWTGALSSGVVNFRINEFDQFTFDFTSYYVERAAGLADVVGRGQIWAGTDQSLNFTDGLGVNTVLTAAGGGIAPGTVTNSTLRWSGAAWVEATGILSIFTGVQTLEIRGSGAFLQLHTTGAALDEKETRIKMDNFAGFAIQSVSDGGFNGPFLMGANRTGTAWQNLQFSVDTEVFGSFYLSNILGVQADLSNRGQLWVDVADDLLHYQDEFGVPQVLDPSLSELNIQNGNYTLLITDKGKTIAKQSGGAGETHTIPANASVAYKIGTWVAWDNDGGGDLTIAITTDTLVGTDGVTGSRTLGDNERALIQKIAATRWRYSASDL
jgi:hypothetical protein